MAWSPIQRVNAGIIWVEQPGDYANPFPTTYATAPKAGSPVAEAVLARIAALYAIEAEIRGKEASIRQSARAERSRPLVAELEGYLRAQAARLSGRSEMGKAVAYLLNHWDGLTLVLQDGRVEMDTNLVENQIRPLTLTRKNSRGRVSLH